MVQWTPTTGFKQSKYAGGWFHWHDWAGTDLSIPREIWSRLSERIVRDGLFNSQFIALMPTSGCAQVTGCSDAFYPFYANASLETRVSAFAQSPAYERIVSSGYLSALRYYDTYLYVGRSGKQESVQHFYMRLAGFCASTTCLYAGLRAALQRARPEIESDMEVFDYYFEHLTSQTVCCSTPFMRFAGVENSTLASCILTLKFTSFSAMARNVKRNL